MTEIAESRSPALLTKLVERMVTAGLAPAGPVQALQMDALMKLLVTKGLLTLDEWDNAFAEAIGSALSRMPEQPKIVTAH